MSSSLSVMIGLWNRCMLSSGLWLCVSWCVFIVSNVLSIGSVLILYVIIYSG